MMPVASLGRWYRGGLWGDSTGITWAAVPEEASGVIPLESSGRWCRRGLRGDASGITWAVVPEEALG